MSLIVVKKFQIIREIEQKRKKEIDQALKDCDEIKEENQALKKKWEAARCRVRNLECDATLIRQKMQTLMEKSNHDDMLVNEQRVSMFPYLCLYPLFIVNR